MKVQPLWLRIERNRVRLAAFVAMFVLFAVLVAEIALFVAFYGLGIVLLLVSARVSFDVGERSLSDAVARLLMHPAPVAEWTAGLGAMLACLYVACAIGRPLRGRLAALGARFVPLGEMLDTKHALKEMSLAAGFDPAPELFVLDSASVNALCLARGKARPFVIVTRGLVERFSRGEQRAVFAHLLARLRSGDVHWATAVSALMAPVWKWREADLSAEDDALSSILLDEPAGAFLGGDSHHRVLGAGGGSGGDVWLLAVWAYAAYMIAVVASEIVMLGHHRSHLTGAITADAEGMLLLKDPVLMLETLKRAIEADNRVRLALPMYAGLFYIWAGDDLIDEQDPDWERIDRLREVVGVDGMVDADAESAAAVTDSMARGFLVAPEAPRLEAVGPAATSAPVVAERVVEPWPDQPVPIATLWGVAMAVFFFGWSAIWLLVRGSSETTRSLLFWTPVVAGLAGLFMGRWWTPALFVIGGGILVSASGMAAGSGAAPTTWRTAAVYAGALVAGGVGAWLNRAIFGSLGRRRR
ncbi:MAG: hypothetical protein C0418_04420 [Coriobacteriaceae bacterium]|nr:hypothetical protein [Coriobacteriaceae bacterium]